MLGSIDKEFGFLHQALGLRSHRQQMLASNIANADTPNYKARDIDFAAELSRVRGGKGGQVGLAVTDPRHLRSAASSLAEVKELYRTDVQASIDGNTVNMDMERAQFTDNALHYQFLVDRISGKVRDLLLAARGQ
jgi:flagellar basal-body rod protein FlgB